MGYSHITAEWKTNTLMRSGTNRLSLRGSDVTEMKMTMPAGDLTSCVYHVYCRVELFLSIELRGSFHIPSSGIPHFRL